MGCLLEDTRNVMLCLVFFFQAEDGIRDLTVTGVQTCALPISRLPAPTRPRARDVQPGLLSGMNQMDLSVPVCTRPGAEREPGRQSMLESNDAPTPWGHSFRLIRLKRTRSLSDDAQFQSCMRRASAPNDIISLPHEVYPSRLIRDHREATHAIERDVSGHTAGLEGAHSLEAVRVDDRHTAGRAQAQIEEGLIGRERDLLERRAECAPRALACRQMHHIEPAFLIPTIET